MNFFSSLFRKKLFKPQPGDLKARWKANVCESCECLEPQYHNRQFGTLNLHSEIQDTNCEAWKFLESLVEKTITSSSKEFSPGDEMPPELWKQIITLPPSIAKLNSVRQLHLYGSNLVRIPTEIGSMENLEELDIYNSYRLHWLPYEITRCRNLKSSRASTRGLYGNYKYRPPFPKLGPDSPNDFTHPVACSVCNRSLKPGPGLQVWISLVVATDVFPLLVNACSEECLRRLPKPANGYVDRPHSGGLEIEQPKPHWS